MITAAPILPVPNKRSRWKAIKRWMTNNIWLVMWGGCALSWIAVVLVIKVLWSLNHVI